LSSGTASGSSTADQHTRFNVVGSSAVAARPTSHAVGHDVERLGRIPDWPISSNEMPMVPTAAGSPPPSVYQRVVWSPSGMARTW